MSEANILNTSSASQLNPQYGWQRARRDAVARIYAASGKTFKRLVGARPLVYRLNWELPKTEALQLEQWGNQYLLDFFTLVDWERTRYYSGHFIEGPVETWIGNEKVGYTAVFEELPGLALNTYPSNWARDAIFLEERNGFSEALVKLTGTWALSGDTSTHGGNDYYSDTTNDTAEWQYFGYGFRLYSVKAPDHGIVELTVSRVRDGAVIVAATNIDLYNPTNLYNQVLYTKSDMALDLYRVKLRVTGTKNASATNYRCRADALEVMQ